MRRERGRGRERGRRGGKRESGGEREGVGKSRDFLAFHGRIGSGDKHYHTATHTHAHTPRSPT